VPGEEDNATSWKIGSKDGVNLELIDYKGHKAAGDPCETGQAIKKEARRNGELHEQARSSRAGLPAGI
jgi:hypothetical protein